MIWLSRALSASCLFRGCSLSRQMTSLIWARWGSYVGGRVTTSRRMWLSLVMLEAFRCACYLVYKANLQYHVSYSEHFQKYPNYFKSIHIYAVIYTYHPCIRDLQVLCIQRTYLSRFLYKKTPSSLCFQTCRLFEATSRIVGWEIGPSLSAGINRPCYPEKAYSSLFTPLKIGIPTGKRRWTVSERGCEKRWSCLGPNSLV